MWEVKEDGLVLPHALVLFHCDTGRELILNASVDIRLSGAVKV